MSGDFIPFALPEFDGQELQEIEEVLRSGWVTSGPKTTDLEREFRSYVGAPAALALSSGTGALHVALASLGIGPGDAVITTPLTFCSTVHVIEQLGARPILVDVERETLNIDPARIEEAVTTADSALSPGPRIRALLPVHLYGHSCEMDSILEIARRYKLAVVEDAAHALPAEYRGRRIGALQGEEDVPRVACFSFYATKNMSTGEGGMLTGRPALVEEGRVWALHGISRDAWRRYESTGSWFYEVVLPGFKYNLSDIQAAIGLVQLRKLPAFQARRREIVRRYHEALGEFEELELPVERPDVEHSWHLYVIRLNLDRLLISRDRFIEELRMRNIGTSVHFIPVHVHRYYREKYGYSAEDFPVAYREYQRIVSLPLYPRMTDDDVERVIGAVAEVVEAHGVRTNHSSSS